MQEYSDYYIKGHYNEEVVDDMEIMCPITAFEKTLPVRKIYLEEYERRIKSLVSPGTQDCITVR